MLVATNRAGELITAWRADSWESYRCPDCQRPVVLRGASAHRGAHFAHRGVECTGGGESSIHQAGKATLYDWARRRGWAPELEVRMNGGRQRADLLVHLATGPLVVEYQCSPLTVPRLAARTRGYQSLGYPVRWLLGPRYRRHLHRATAAAFTQLVGGTPCLTFWDPERGQLSYRWPPWQSLTGDAGRALLESRWLFRRRPVGSGLVARAYRAGHPLAACPLLAHQGGEWWPLTAAAPLEWRIGLLLALEHVPLGYRWEGATWGAWVSRQTAWLPLGAVGKDTATLLHQWCLTRLTDSWTRAGVLATTPAGITLVRHPRWFPSYAAKVAWLQKSSPTEWLGRLRNL